MRYHSCISIMIVRIGPTTPRIRKNGSIEMSAFQSGTMMDWRKSRKGSTSG
jgi:hypothetical protein